MRKKILLSSLMFIFFLNVSSFANATPESHESQTIEESKLKYQQLNEQTMILDDKISKLNIELEALNSALEESSNEIEKTEVEMKAINSKIEEAEKDIEKNQEILDNRIRSMYKGNISNNMLVYLITAESIFDIFNRVQAIGKIISLDKQMIVSIEEQTEILNKSAKELEKKQLEIYALQNSIKNNLATVNEKKAEQEILLDELNSQKEDIFKIIEANEEKLISHPLSIIYSSSSTESELQSAINTLKLLIPQLNSEYVIGLAQNAIDEASIKIEEANKPILPPPSSSEYISTFTMEATAYTGGGFTAMGLKPVRDPNGISTIAVDPNVIPLGSKVHIPGYGYAIASDTGGAIKGNKVDLYFNTEEECISWGRRSITVHLIAYPGEW